MATEATPSPEQVLNERIGAALSLVTDKQLRQGLSGVSLTLFHLACALWGAWKQAHIYEPSPSPELLAALRYQTLTLLKTEPSQQSADIAVAVRGVLRAMMARETASGFFSSADDCEKVHNAIHSYMLYSTYYTELQKENSR